MGHQEDALGSVAYRNGSLCNESVELKLSPGQNQHRLGTTASEIKIKSLAEWKSFAVRANFSIKLIQIEAFV